MVLGDKWVSVEQEQMEYGWAAMRKETAGVFEELRRLNKPV